MAADQAKTGDDRDRVAGELEEARRAREEAGTRCDDGVEALGEVEGSIPGLEETVAAAAERSGQAAAAAGVLDRRRAELAAQRQQLEVRSAGLAERGGSWPSGGPRWSAGWRATPRSGPPAAARRRRLEADGVALRRLDTLVEASGGRLERVLDALRVDYRHQVEAVRAGGERLETLRRDRAAADGRLSEVRERSRALDLEAAEVSLAQRGPDRDRPTRTGQRHRRRCWRPRHRRSPRGRRPPSTRPVWPTSWPRSGPVNPLALEELSALEERHRELDTQVDDVRSARRELQEVVRTLDEEIMQSFAAAAADVNEHFSALVSMLFPGGTGRLSLTEPDDLLNTGVEIEVRPAGRNVRRVSLLSGGERSLAALAFLFAVFRSRPSPFYLMDEVEAALDDVNLHRFLGLVREFRDEAQLIIVSHQKRTMETGDALYGVTMAPGRLLPGGEPEGDPGAGGGRALAGRAAGRVGPDPGREVTGRL